MNVYARTSGKRFERVTPPVPYNDHRHGGNFRGWVEEIAQVTGLDAQYLIVTESGGAYLYEATQLAPRPKPPVEVMPI